MTAIPNDTGMGPEAPATATRSIRRTRRLAIVGALALVLVAGAVLVGVKTTGARSGATATQSAIGVKCVTSGKPVNGQYPITVTFTTDGTSHTILYYDGSDQGSYFSLGSTTTGTFTSSHSTDAIFNTRIKVSWANDTKYDYAACTRS